MTMISQFLILAGLLALTLTKAYKLQKNPYASKWPLKSVPDWLTEDGVGNTLTVRFINTPSGKDVVVDGVKQGSNLLFIGDSAGVSLPRACRTGLCGSCTCEVKDPAAVATPTNPRDGFATLRACSTKCYVPDGLDEMVVDVRRMSTKKTVTTGNDGTSTEMFESETVANPMARFSGDWERDFKPQWDLARDGQLGDIQLKPSQKACSKCLGAGRIVCYACLGVGSIKSEDGTRSCQCATCVGMQTVGCGYCNASGVQMKKAKKL